MKRQLHRYDDYDHMVAQTIAEAQRRNIVLASSHEVNAMVRALYPDEPLYAVMGFTIAEAVMGFEDGRAAARLRAARVHIFTHGKVISARRYWHFGAEWGDFWELWCATTTDEERDTLVAQAQACLDERRVQEKTARGAASGDLGQIRQLTQFLHSLSCGALCQPGFDNEYRIVRPRSRRAS